MKRVGTSVAIAAVAAGGMAEAARAIEVRWVNPEGGAWNDGANWDAGRVPADGEGVVFDLDGAYTVTVGGDRPAMWSHFRVDRSRLTLDLVGGALAVQPDGVYDWDAGIEVGAEPGSGAELTVTNGTVFDPDSWLLDAWIRVDGTDGEPTRFALAPDASTGPLARLDLLGTADLAVDGWMDLGFAGELRIDPGATATVTGDLTGGEFAVVGLQGTLDVDGLVSAFESSIAGSGGVLRVRPGGLVEGWYLYDGLRITPEQGGLVSSPYVADAVVDLRGAGDETFFEMNELYGLAVFERVVFEFNLCSASGVPEVAFGDSFEWGFWDSVVRLGGECVPDIGQTELLVRWRVPPTFSGSGGDDCSLPTYRQLAMETQTEADHGAVLRWGPIDAETAGLFALGVPEDWCEADLNFDGVANVFDLAVFLNAYQTRSPWADCNGDMVVDFYDVTDFVALLTAGCSAP